MNDSENSKKPAENRQSEKLRAQPPIENEPLEVSAPETTAAGLTAITTTLKHGFAEMGVARTLKTLAAINQKGGFDCQSCAWIDPDGARTLAEFCENGARAMASEGTKKRITREFFEKYSVAELSQKSDYWHNEQGRLTEPVILRAGKTHYEPLSWNEAFAFIAAELNALDSPDEAVFYTSGRTSNEAAFLYQLFVRQFGTNNLPDCSNMCHESTSFALGEAVGLGKASVTHSDFAKAELIIIMGQNPGTNHPRMMSSLQDAKRSGARIIAVNPLREAGLLNFINPNPQHYKNPLEFPAAMFGGKATKLADLYLQIRVGGDMAFLKGVMKHVLARAEKDEKILDLEFIANKTSGFEELKAHLATISWEIIVGQSGLTQAEITEAAEMFINADAVITCWAMGVTQHKRAVGAIQDIVNLHLLRGQIGKPGAGLCPVRGHSNVQGDRTVGIWEKMPEKFLAALDREFNFTSPRAYGLDTVKAIRAMHEGRAKVFFAMGGNFLSATPDTEFTAAALQKCRLTVQVLTKLNRSAIVTGDAAIILPCLGRSEIDRQAGGEQFVSTENTSGVVQMSKGVLEPASENLRSEPWIVANLAKAVLGAKSTVDWDAFAADYDRIRDSIERVVDGFERYNERVREPGGFYLPNKPRMREFGTASGKALFKIHEIEPVNLKPDEFLMTTVRAHSQFNTTVYEPKDRYRGVEGNRRIVFLNEEDIREFGFEAGQKVDLTSHFMGETRRAESFVIVPYPISRRCAATYFPEANVLVPLGSTAEKSNCPTSKSVIITIAPAKKRI